VIGPQLKTAPSWIGFLFIRSNRKVSPIGESGFLGNGHQLPRRDADFTAKTEQKRVTRVKADTLFDSKSELAKLSSGQTDKSQKVSIGSLSQESRGSNVVSFTESVVDAAVGAAVKP
jgi:hypothetical protein